MTRQPPPSVATPPEVRDGFAELARQQDLLASCTWLYQQLTEQFGALERGISSCSESLRAIRCVFDVLTSRRLDALHRREVSIEGSVSFALSLLNSLAEGTAREGITSSDASIAEGFKSLCSNMDSTGFLDFVVERCKEADVLRAELLDALKQCVNPARFVMDVISKVFPMDKRSMRSPTDLVWACVLILEAVIPQRSATQMVGQDRRAAPKQGLPA